MMGPFLGPKKLTTLTNNINNNKLNKKFHSCRGDTRYPSNEIYLHSVKDGFGSMPYIYSFLLQQVEISALSESADD